MAPDLRFDLRGRCLAAAVLSREGAHDFADVVVFVKSEDCFSLLNLNFNLEQQLSLLPKHKRLAHRRLSSVRPLAEHCLLLALLRLRLPQSANRLLEALDLRHARLEERLAGVWLESTRFQICVFLPFPRRHLFPFPCGWMPGLDLGRDQLGLERAVIQLAVLVLLPDQLQAFLDLLLLLNHLVHPGYVGAREAAIHSFPSDLAGLQMPLPVELH